MRWYIAYKFTGEDSKEVRGILNNLCSILESNGHKNYCVLLDNNLIDKGEKEIFDNALNEIDNCDGVLIFVKSEKKSEGMLIEAGYALAKGKRLVLIIQKDIKNTRLRELIEEVIEFEDIDELKDKLKNLK